VLKLIYKRVARLISKLLNDLFGFIYPALLEAVKTETDSEVLVVGIETIHECIDVMGDNVLNQALLKDLLIIIQILIQGSQSRRSKLMKSNPDGDIDDSYIIRDELAKEDDIINEIAEAFGIIGKRHKSYFLSAFQATDLPAMILQMSQTTSVAPERQLSVCIFDDLVEYTNEQSYPLFSHFVPLMLEYTLDPNPGVRQAAAYGLGICAQNGGPIIKPYLPQILDVLLKAINEPNSRTDEKMIPPTENAISSVGRIIQYQPELLGDKLPQLTDIWVSWLPIEVDSIEAKLVHQQLCYFIKHINSCVFGTNGKNLVKVLDIFGRIVDTDLITPETQNTIKEILASMYKQLDPNFFQNALLSISPQSQQKLRNLK
jgi:hypothetical protein